MQLVGVPQCVGVPQRVGVPQHVGVPQRVDVSQHVGVPQRVGVSQHIGCAQCVGVPGSACSRSPCPQPSMVPLLQRRLFPAALAISY